MLLTSSLAKLRPPFRYRFHRILSKTTLLIVEGQLDYNATTLNVLFTLSANRRSPIDLDESTLTTTIDGYANLTGSARTEYQLTPTTNFVFSGQYFTQEQEGISQSSSIVFDRLGEIQNYSGGLWIEHKLSFENIQSISSIFLTGKLYATRYDDESTVVDRDISEITSQNLNIQDLIKGEVQFDTTLWEKHQLTVGGEVIFENLQSQRIEGRERDIFTNSLFIQNEFRPISAFAVVIGGRLDNHSEFGTHFSPKLSSLYRMTNNFRVRASYGQGFRSPRF